MRSEISHTFFFKPLLDNNIITLLFFHCLVDGSCDKRKRDELHLKLKPNS